MKKLTKNFLESIGIYHMELKFHPKKYYVDSLNEEITIHDSYDISDIFKLIYELGESRGIEKGKLQKISEIKRVLNIDENFE